MKKRRFQSGGIAEGANTGITDDVRARALRFVMGESGSAPASSQAPVDPLAEIISSAQERDKRRQVDPLAEIIKGAQGRDKKRQVSTAIQDVIKMGRELEKKRAEEEKEVALLERAMNTAGFDIPVGTGEYLGAIDRPSYPTEKRSKKKKSQGMKSGGMVSASKRGDGIAKRGKTRGRIC